MNYLVGLTADLGNGCWLAAAPNDEYVGGDRGQGQIGLLQARLP
jgi:hypothetical protein